MNIGLVAQNEIGFYVCIAIALVCFVAAILLAWKGRSHRQMLDHWAEEHGMTLLSVRRSWWRYFISSAVSVFYLTVKDPQGRVLEGVARVGGFTGLRDHVKVSWDLE